jgi:hypothetical protein
MSDNMSVDKKSPPKEESEESMGSSPEGEAPAQPPASAAPAASSTPAASNDNNASGAGVSAQQPENQQPKRKGGRKPVRYQLAVVGCAQTAILPLKRCSDRPVGMRSPLIFHLISCPSSCRV